MKIKEKLEMYPYIPEEVRELNQQLIDIADNRYDVSITSKISGVPGSREISDKTYRQVEKICDKDDYEVHEIGKRIKELTKAHREVKRMLIKMTDNEKKIIELRFFQKRRWNLIPSQMSYSMSQCRRIYQSAYSKIKEDI